MGWSGWGAVAEVAVEEERGVGIQGSVIGGLRGEGHLVPGPAPQPRLLAQRQAQLVPAQLLCSPRRESKGAEAPEESVEAPALSDVALGVDEVADVEEAAPDQGLGREVKVPAQLPRVPRHVQAHLEQLPGQQHLPVPIHSLYKGRRRRKGQLEGGGEASEGAEVEEEVFEGAAPAHRHLHQRHRPLASAGRPDGPLAVQSHGF